MSRCRTLPSEKARDDDSVGTAGHGVLTRYFSSDRKVYQTFIYTYISLCWLLLLLLLLLTPVTTICGK